jgi:hypothetical protein
MAGSTEKITKWYVGLQSLSLGLFEAGLVGFLQAPPGVFQCNHGVAGLLSIGHSHLAPVKKQNKL